jgi:hypothetical protein
MLKINKRNSKRYLFWIEVLNSSITTIKSLNLQSLKILHQLKKAIINNSKSINKISGVKKLIKTKN